MRNIKQIGNDFEEDACEMLAHDGYWVHFIVPNAQGAQPFDIIAVKDGRPLALDCKTCVAKTFNISRLEDNQITSFEKWLACGNPEPYIFVKHEDMVYKIPYSVLKKNGKVKLKDWHDKVKLEDSND